MVRAWAGLGKVQIIGGEVALMLPSVQKHPDLTIQCASENSRKHAAASTARVVLFDSLSSDCPLSVERQGLVRVSGRRLAVEMRARSAGLNPKSHALLSQEGACQVNYEGFFSAVSSNVASFVVIDHPLRNKPGQQLASGGSIVLRQVSVQTKRVVREMNTDLSGNLALICRLPRQGPRNDEIVLTVVMPRISCAGRKHRDNPVEQARQIASTLVSGWHGTLQC